MWRVEDREYIFMGPFRISEWSNVERSANVCLQIVGLDLFFF